MGIQLLGPFMISPRPLVFISAVTSELKSARQLVANTLTFLGYEPVWQDIFGTKGGDLRQVLREKIDQCKGVLQLVGKCYGSAPATPDEQFGKVSYTQYEALYARERGKKVWYLFIDENFPADPCEGESGELRELKAPRARLSKLRVRFWDMISRIRSRLGTSWRWLWPIRARSMKRRKSIGKSFDSERNGSGQSVR